MEKSNIKLARITYTDNYNNNYNNYCNTLCGRKGKIPFVKSVSTCQKINTP